MSVEEWDLVVETECVTESISSYKMQEFITELQSKMDFSSSKIIFSVANTKYPVLWVLVSNVYLKLPLFRMFLYWTLYM